MGDRAYRIERSTELGAPVEAVRRLLLDPATWPGWQPEIVNAHGPEPLADGDVAQGEARMLGFDVHGHTEALEVTDAIFEQDVIVGVRMIIRYEIRPSASGTRVIHEMTAFLPGGISGRVLSFFLRPRLRALQRGVLEGLVRQSGSSPA